MTAFRVGALNAQRGNGKIPQLKARIVAAHPRILLTNEDQDLGTIPGYTRYGAVGDASAPRRDCAIHVRRLPNRDHVDVVDWGVEKGSDAVPGRPVQHDRHFVWMKAEINADRFAFISYHGNAAIQDTNGRVRDSRGADESADLFRMIGAMCELFRSGGWAPIVGGDGNVWPDSGWPYAPDHYWRTHGLEYRGVGVDGIGADRRTLRYEWLRSTRAPGVDAPHRFVIAKLRTR